MCVDFHQKKIKRNDAYDKYINFDKIIAIFSFIGNPILEAKKREEYKKDMKFKLVKKLYQQMNQSIY